MELQKFISTTLVQIAKGIEDAAKELQETTALINPRNVDTNTTNKPCVYGYLNTSKAFYKVVQKIDFDVAVTVEKGTETKGGIGIQVGSIGVGSQGKTEKGNSSVSRIQFSVPMVLPMDNAPHDSENSK